MRMVSMIGVAVFVMTVGVFAGQTELSKLAVNVKLVTLQFQNAELSDVLLFLGKATGIEIRLAPEVVAPKPVTVKFTSTRFEDVFTFLLADGNLGYSVVDEKTVLVTPKRP